MRATTRETRRGQRLNQAERPLARPPWAARLLGSLLLWASLGLVSCQALLTW